MRGWRRSSRARARDAASPTAPAPNPFAPLAWPPPPVEALLVDPAPEPEPQAPAPAPAAAVPPAEYPVAPAAAVAPPGFPAAQLEPQMPVAAPALTSPEAQAELLRLFEVVTNMCDHVIEYIETDRAERRMMLETLATLGQTITASAAALAPLIASVTQTVEARVIEQPEPRERVVGGSMPVGPEPVIDLRSSPVAAGPTPVASPAPALEQSASPEPSTGASAAVESSPTADARSATTTTTVMTTEIAVEVRGRFGDRWVDGFEICEVMETPEGHRYRLRRQRDGVVLPELFDATSIRHVETFDQLSAMNGANVQHVSRQPATHETNVTDATGYADPALNGASTRWSRS